MDISILASKNSNKHNGNGSKTWLATFFERSIFAKRILLFIAILGMCMLIGDGILTPAISGSYSLIFIYSNIFCFMLLVLGLIVFSIGSLVCN